MIRANRSVSLQTSHLESLWLKVALAYQKAWFHSQKNYQKLEKSLDAEEKCKAHSSTLTSHNLKKTSLIPPGFCMRTSRQSRLTNDECDLMIGIIMKYVIDAQEQFRLLQ
jgi:hypothetical protein